MKTPFLQGKTHPGGTSKYSLPIRFSPCPMLVAGAQRPPVPWPSCAASPAAAAALTAFGFAPFWLRGLWFLIHHSSQRLQGRQQSGRCRPGREVGVPMGCWLWCQDPWAFGARGQPRTHVFLVILPFLALLVGHNDARPQGLKHGVAPVGCCWGTGMVRGVQLQDTTR